MTELKKDNASWSQQAQLKASDGAAGDEFGNSVAASGSTVVVGAPNHGGWQGAAYVFVQNGTKWTQQAELLASDGASGDNFGLSVAISGNTIVVGAPNHGAAYIYMGSSGTWTEQAELTAPGVAGCCFGVSVAISGSTVVVGGQGEAYAFAESGGTWTPQQLSPSGGGGGFYGNSVAVEGSTILVGSIYAEAAYVFVENGGTWSQQAQLTASDDAGTDYFGGSVAVEGGTAIVGAFYHPSKNGVPGPGAAYVFAESGGTWSQQAELTASDGVNDDFFGYSVEVLGGTVMVGAPIHAVGSKDGQGAVYVYAGSGETWMQQVELTASHGAANDFFGIIGASDSTVVVGANCHPGASKSCGSGAAYVFVPGGSTPSYTLSASPSSLSVAQGSQGTSTITIMPVNGFSGNVSLSASGLPNGVTAAFNPNPATSTSTLTLTATGTATTGTLTVTVTGTSGSLTETTTLELTLTSQTTTAVTSSSNPSAYGQSVSFTATVTGNSPTGTVQFAIDGTNFGTPVTLVSGSATSNTISTLTVGTHTVTATYSGDKNNPGSSGALSGGQVVSAATSATVVTSSANPSTYGQSVTFTATISGEYGQVKGNRNGKPKTVTGTVAWSSNTGCGTTSVTAGNLGTATCTSSSLTVGTNTVTASYSGDSNHGASSGSVTETINQASQTITVTTAAPATAIDGSSFTIVASSSSGLPVTYASFGACTNSGTTYLISYSAPIGTTCTEILTQAGNNDFSAAPTVTETTTVAAPETPTVSFTSTASSAQYGTTFSVTASSNETGAVVSIPAITSGTPAICQITSSTTSGTSVTATVEMLSGSGSCDLGAHWAINTVYSAATANVQVTAERVTPTVSFTGAPSTANSGATFAVTAVSNETTGKTAVPTIKASGSCTVGSATNTGPGTYQATVTMTRSTGTCTTTAAWAGTTDYVAASATQTTTAE